MGYFWKYSLEKRSKIRFSLAGIKKSKLCGYLFDRKHRWFLKFHSWFSQKIFVFNDEWSFFRPKTAIYAEILRVLERFALFCAKNKVSHRNMRFLRALACVLEKVRKTCVRYFSIFFENAKTLKKIYVLSKLHLLDRSPGHSFLI